MHSKIHQIRSISYNESIGLGYNLHLVEVDRTELDDNNAPDGDRVTEYVYIRFGLDFLPLNAIQDKGDLDVLLFLEKVVTGLDVVGSKDNKKGVISYNNNRGIVNPACDQTVFIFDIVLWPAPHTH